MFNKRNQRRQTRSRFNGRTRSTCGTISIELAVILPLVALIMVLCINLSLFVLAVRANDLACRDAARAASRCETAEKAQRAAAAAAASHKFLGATPRLVLREFKYEVPPVFSPAALKAPQVHVATVLSTGTTLGNTFSMITNANANTGNVYREYTFPIMNIARRDQNQPQT